jgi:hypothetical protein
MKNNSYELNVLVGDKPLREYGHKGLTYVVGEKDKNFTLRFRNNTSARVLARDQCRRNIRGRR